MNQSAMRVRNVFDHADWGDRKRRVASTSCSAVLLPPGQAVAVGGRLKRALD